MALAASMGHPRWFLSGAGFLLLFETFVEMEAGTALAGSPRSSSLSAEFTRARTFGVAPEAITMNKREPETKEVQYRQIVFLCDRGGHEAARVYLWRGEWLCRSHFNEAKRAAGAKGLSLYTVDYGDEQFRPEGVRHVSKIERVTPPGPEPLKLVSRRTAQREGRKKRARILSAAKEAALSLPSPNEVRFAISLLDGSYKEL